MRNKWRFGMLGATCALFSGLVLSVQAQPDRMNSYLPAGGYTLHIDSDSATFTVEVPEGVAIAIESEAGVVPLPNRDPSVPRLYRGDVTLTFFRPAAHDLADPPSDEVVVVAPVGIAVRDGSVTIRKHD